MNPKVKTVLKIISSAMACIVVILAMLLVGVRIFGVEVLTILSPSMEPKYPTGSVIYVVDTDPAELKVRDVITFRLSENMTATHRIIELIPDEDDPSIVRFRTKGDNNNTVDGALVEFGDVIGKPVLCIPLLGYLAMYIQSPPGSYIAIGVALVMILFVMIVDIITDDKKDSKNKLNKGEDHNEEN